MASFKVKLQKDLNYFIASILHIIFVFKKKIEFK